MTETGWRVAVHSTLQDTGWSELFSPHELADAIDEMVQDYRRAVR